MTDNSAVNGIICINKPQDFTSFDVIAVLRKAAGTRKLGHGGTLDPMATGVLPVFIGRAAKVTDLNPADDKRYTAGFRFGVSTDTEDVWGRELSSDDTPVDEEKLISAIGAMQGNIMQTPPMYSAVKVGGKKLYELARQGVEIERAARPITVHSIRLLSYDSDSRSGVLDIHCSKGTYIRTLICDIAKRLGTMGIMTSLVRTQSGGFTLADCYELDEIRNLAPEQLSEKTICTERLFEAYKEAVLSDKQRRMFLNGVTLDIGRMNVTAAEGETFRIMDQRGVFLGLGVADSENGIKQKFLNVLS